MIAGHTEAFTTIHNFLRSENPGLPEIDPDVDLIDSRLIDSLKFVNFIFLLEQVTGRELQLSEIDVDDFRSLRRISERFLGGLPHVH